MHITKIFSLILLFSWANSNVAQYIDSTHLNKLLTHNPLPYKDEKGNSISEKSMESYGVRVVFYSFFLDRMKKKAKIRGRIIDPSVIGDTSGVINYIFLATPSNNKLTKLRTLKKSYERRNDEIHGYRFPFRTGDFQLEFFFNDRERLYFNSELTFPVEYNIGELLKEEKDKLY